MSSTAARDATSAKDLRAWLDLDEVAARWLITYPQLLDLLLEEQVRAAIRILTPTEARRGEDFSKKATLEGGLVDLVSPLDRVARFELAQYRALALYDEELRVPSFTGLDGIVVISSDERFLLPWHRLEQSALLRNEFVVRLEELARVEQRIGTNHVTNDSPVNGPEGGVLPSSFLEPKVVAPRSERVSTSTKASSVENRPLGKVERQKLLAIAAALSKKVGAGESPLNEGSDRNTVEKTIASLMGDWLVARENPYTAAARLDVNGAQPQTVARHLARIGRHPGLVAAKTSSRRSPTKK